jgi:hypothetical protein
MRPRLPGNAGTVAPENSAHSARFPAVPGLYSVRGVEPGMADAGLSRKPPKIFVEFRRTFCERPLSHQKPVAGFGVGPGQAGNAARRIVPNTTSSIHSRPTTPSGSHANGLYVFPFVGGPFSRGPSQSLLLRRRCSNGREQAGIRGAESGRRRRDGSPPEAHGFRRGPGRTCGESNLRAHPAGLCAAERQSTRHAATQPGTPGRCRHTGRSARSSAGDSLHPKLRNRRLAGPLDGATDRGETSLARRHSCRRDRYSRLRASRRLGGSRILTGVQTTRSARVRRLQALSGTLNA